VMEAILWHGGEAESARDLFMGFTKSQREDLIAFVNVL
ncbi:MAG: Di-hem oxidoreductase, putative peroxidase, partial [Pseudomonadota bacterium]